MRNIEIIEKFDAGNFPKLIYVDDQCKMYSDKIFNDIRNNIDGTRDKLIDMILDEVHKEYNLNDDEKIFLKNQLLTYGN